MTFRGVIENGRLVLEDGARLADGTHVDVTVQKAAKRASRAKIGTDSLARLSRRSVSTGLSDLADEHDHYAYGTPKRASSRTKRIVKSGSRK